MPGSSTPVSSTTVSSTSVSSTVVSSTVVSPTQPYRDANMTTDTILIRNLPISSLQLLLTCKLRMLNE